MTASERQDSGTTVTRTALFDGRDIIYFTDRGSPLTPGGVADSRPVAPRSTTPEMRWDALAGEWISIASQRNDRPHLPTDSRCPLCVQSPDNPSEIPEGFCVAVFENRNPSFGPQVGDGTIDNSSAPFGRHKPAIGRCEVVVFSPEHRGSLGGLGVERIRTVITAWQHRTRELLETPGIVSVFPFENRGQDIGVTLSHPHGQIYGYPFVPPTQQKLLTAVGTHGASFFDDLLNYEDSGSRVLYRSEAFTVYVPYAARWPVEVTLMPRRQIGTLDALDSAEVEELATVYGSILQALDRLYDSELPYISGWYQAPQAAGGEDIRLHLKITSPRRAADKLKYLAGSESMMGAFISDVTPEDQARRLREVMS